MQIIHRSYTPRMLFIMLLALHGLLLSPMNSSQAKSTHSKAKCDQKCKIGSGSAGAIVGVGGIKATQPSKNPDYHLDGQDFRYVSEILKATPFR